MDLAPGQRLHLGIEKLSMGGDGIARVPVQGREGPAVCVVFVPYSAPGDQLHVEITEKRKNFARARILKILKPGAGRKEAPCSHYFMPGKKFACGGCSLQHLEYPAQLRIKTDYFKETLVKIGQVPLSAVLEPLGPPEGAEWRYRNKMQVPFGRNDKTGEISAGFYSAGSHQIVPMRDCLIHSEDMVRFVHFVRETLGEWGLQAYSEKTHRGWLRHLLLRREESGGDMLAVFVTLSDIFPRQGEWIQSVQKRFPKVAGVFQNVNPEKTNVILGKKWKSLFGRDFLVESLNGLGKDKGVLKLKISAGSFFQVNTRMAEKLYEIARDFALEQEPSGRKHLLDLYCGVGGIGLTLAPYFESVLGVEETPSSIRDAKENAQANGIGNARFSCQDVLSFVGQWGRTHADGRGTVAVLDPPRMGCEEIFLRGLAGIRPDKIIYVSCEPSTLARDLRFLCGAGYRLRKVQPVDLFPQSAHIESVSLLEKME